MIVILTDTRVIYGVIFNLCGHANLSRFTLYPRIDYLIIFSFTKYKRPSFTIIYVHVNICRGKSLKYGKLQEEQFGSLNTEADLLSINDNIENFNATNDEIINEGHREIDEYSKGDSSIERSSHLNGSLDDVYSGSEKVTLNGENFRDTTLEALDIALQKEQEEEETKAARKNLLSYKDMVRYIQVSRESKCIVYLMEEFRDSAVPESQSTINCETEVNSNSEEAASDTNYKPKSHEGDDTFEIYSRAAVGVKCRVYCGQDDGTVSCVELTQTLLDIGVLPIAGTAAVAFNPGYNPRRKNRRSPSEGDIERLTVSSEEVYQRERFASAHLRTVWTAHAASVTDMKIVGDNNDVLSCSEDQSVLGWSNLGVRRGILTWGQELDKVLRHTWYSPVNLALRKSRRNAVAAQYIDQLNLKPTHHLVLKGIRQSADFDDNQEVTTDEHVSTKYYARLNESKIDAENSVEKKRVIGQLRGEITYDQSSKDFAKTALEKTKTDALRRIHSIGAEEPKKRRQGRPALGQDYRRNLTGDNAYYYETASMSTEYVNSCSGNWVYVPVKRVQSQYDFELSQIDASDPNNWVMTTFLINMSINK